MNIKLPVVRGNPKGSIEALRPVYMMRFRNNVITRILISPIGRGRSSRDSKKSVKYKSEYKFTSVTPTIVKRKVAQPNEASVFQDRTLQAKYQELIKGYNF